MDNNLTTNNISLPKICLGTWEIAGYPFFAKSSNKYIEKFIETAIENEITFFDTSPIYGLGSAESIVGKVQNKIKRNEVIIATKGGLRWSEIKDNKPLTYT